jgi:hypothetical protein
MCSTLELSLWNWFIVVVYYLQAFMNVMNINVFCIVKLLSLIDILLNSLLNIAAI